MALAKRAQRAQNTAAGQAAPAEAVKEQVTVVVVAPEQSPVPLTRNWLSPVGVAATSVMPLTKGCNRVAVHTLFALNTTALRLPALLPA